MIGQLVDVSVLAGPDGRPSNVTEPLAIPPELTVLPGSTQPKPGQFAFRILSPVYGDQRIVWDSCSLAEINAAKELFTDLIKKGLTPYKVGRDGKKSSEVMREFDATAEEVIFVPIKLVVGG